MCDIATIAFTSQQSDEWSLFPHSYHTYLHGGDCAVFVAPSNYPTATVGQCQQHISVTPEKEDFGEHIGDVKLLYMLVHLTGWEVHNNIELHMDAIRYVSCIAINIGLFVWLLRILSCLVAFNLPFDSVKVSTRIVCHNPEKTFLVRSYKPYHLLSCFIRGFITILFLNSFNFVKSLCSWFQSIKLGHLAVMFCCSKNSYFRTTASLSVFW